MRKIWCVDNIKKYIEENDYYFIEMIEDKGLNSIVKIRCDEGHECDINFKNFRSSTSNKGQGCPKCKGRRWSYDEVENYVKSKGLILLSDTYINSTTKLKLMCTNNHVFERSLSSIKSSNNTTCQYCEGGKLSVTIELIRDFLDKIGYKLISDKYVNATTKLELKCDNGHTFHKTWNKIKMGQRCPFCRMSKGEIVIYDFLKNKDINFVYNKEYFKDLKSESGFYLRPDFILPDLKIWIEYDGEFHFKNMVGEDSYIKLKKHDDLKNMYAKNNGWKMIRIPYWEFNNIEKILTNNL